MRTLDALLSEYVGASPGVRLGGVPTPDDETIRLQAEVRTLIGRKDLVLTICAGMVLVLFAAQIGIAIVYAGTPAILKATTAAFGVSAFGLVTFMAKLWRERTRLATMITLAAALGPDQLREVVQRLLEVWYPRRKG